MGRKQVYKELKRPDEFVSLVGRIGRALAERKREVLVGIIAMICGWGGFLVWNAWETKKNVKAADAFEEAVSTFSEPAPSTDADADTTVTPWPERLKKLETFIQEFGDSSFFASAQLYLGRGFLETGEFGKARKAYQAAAKKMSKPYQYLAEEGEGVALMELKKWKEAEATFSSLAKAEDNPTQALHTWYLGMVQERSDQVQKAIETYQAFETKFGDSPLLERVQFRISSLQQGS